MHEWSGDELLGFIEVAPHALVFVNSDGKIVLVNKQSENLFGYPRIEMLGQRIEMLLPERFRARHPGHFTHYADLPHVHPMGSNLELLARRRDGSEFPVEISLSPVKTKRGMFFSSAIHDISAIKRSRVEAETDRVRLMAAQEVAHIGSFEIDMVTGDRWWSAEYWRILGVDNTQPPSQELFLTAVHPDDRDVVEGVWQEFASGGPATKCAYRILLPSGEVRWVRSLIAFTHANDGSLTRVIGTTMDINDLHFAGAQRQKAEANFQLAFELSPIGMGIVDPDGRFHQVNPAICEIFGHTEENVLGKRAQDFQHPENGTGSSTLRAHKLESAHVERRYLRPDGQAVWVLETVTLVSGSDGKPTYSFMQLQDITSRKQTEEKLRHQAFRDPLTGLANRSLLTKNLEYLLARARKSGNQVCVLLLDIDQFKIVNDGLGHTAGDDMLVQMATRLQPLVRATDTFSRFGGDEFIIASENMTQEDAEQLADRILTAIKVPFVLEGREVFVTASVGIVLTSGHEDAVTVLRNSDTAMYRAKTRGRAQAMVFSEDMHHRVSAQLELKSQLARALEKNELRVYYQPIVEVATEKIVGFEALVRWVHPKRGLISPGDFIPIAEDTGLIIPIGEWVLRQALAQAQKWRTELPQAAGLSMSVNLSILQLQDPNLVGVVADALAQTGFDQTALHLEITESMLMDDIEVAMKALHDLRLLGVQLSVDDFGTGHASLSYLSRLPVQTLKIDGSFVQGITGDDPKASSIVQVIVDLARALGLHVVAEGVETKEQLKELRRMGSHLAQGFLWSRPLSSEEIPDILTLGVGAFGRAPYPG